VPDAGAEGDGEGEAKADLVDGIVRAGKDAEAENLGVVEAGKEVEVGKSVGAKAGNLSGRPQRRKT
jgi:hypothetical protein